MKARKFDADFDSGKKITDALDLSRASRPLQAERRVSLDLPNLGAPCNAPPVAPKATGTPARSAGRDAAEGRDVTGPPSDINLLSEGGL